MNKQVEQIRAEVERRLNEITIKAGEARPRLHGKRQAYLEVLAIIDSLPEEKSAEGLEEAAHLIAIETLNDTKFMTTTMGYVLGKLQDIFIAGAKWGAEHQVIDGNKTIEPSKDVEEAAEEYRRESFKKSVMPQIDGPTSEYVGNIKSAFIAGAKWKAEHTEDYPMPEDTVLFQKGVAEGRRLEKDDVMKDLPKWKKNAGALRYGILEDEYGRYIQHDGYKLYFDDLLKLPKED